MFENKSLPHFMKTEKQENFPFRGPEFAISIIFIYWKKKKNDKGKCKLSQLKNRGNFKSSNLC